MIRRPIIIGCLLCASTSPWAGPARVPESQRHILDLLDRYERGEFEAVVHQLPEGRELVAIARALSEDGERWTNGSASNNSARKRLVAASLALEIAHLGLDDQWLALRSVVEWACRLLRKSAPTSAELKWQLAALALAQGARDEGFLFTHGSEDTYGHLAHAEQRFPSEARFQLARALELESQAPLESPRSGGEWTGIPSETKAQIRRLTEQTILQLRRLLDVEEIGGEAALHIGYLNDALVRGKEAREAYSDALRLSRDPYVQYLAFYFGGRGYEREGRFQEAEDVYRRALAVMPRAQSGTLSRAAMLFRLDRADEAYSIVEKSFDGSPRPPDPWRLYGYADYRRWPSAIADLRNEISSWR